MRETVNITIDLDVDIMIKIFRQMEPEKQTEFLIKLYDCIESSKKQLPLMEKIRKFWKETPI